MKKLITLLALCATVSSAQAQSNPEPYTSRTYQDTQELLETGERHLFEVCIWIGDQVEEMRNTIRRIRVLEKQSVITAQKFDEIADLKLKVLVLNDQVINLLENSYIFSIYNKRTGGKYFKQLMDYANLRTNKLPERI